MPDNPPITWSITREVSILGLPENTRLNQFRKVHKVNFIPGIELRASSYNHHNANSWGHWDSQIIYAMAFRVSYKNYKLNKAKSKYLYFIFNNEIEKTPKLFGIAPHFPRSDQAVRTLSFRFIFISKQSHTSHDEKSRNIIKTLRSIQFT